MKRTDVVEIKCAKCKRLATIYAIMRTGPYAGQVLCQVCLDEQGNQLGPSETK